MTLTSIGKAPARALIGNAGRLLQGYLPWLMLLLIVGGLAAWLPTFLTVNNLLNILRQSSFIGIVAVGMSFTMIAGAFDLSVGSIMGLAAVILLKAQPLDTSMMLAGAGLAFGAALLIGLANGFAVGIMQTNSVVTTIGTAFVVLGLTLIYTQSQNVTAVGIHPLLEYVSGGRLYRFPVPAILFLIIAVAAQFTLAVTGYGRQLYATGGNTAAARLSGVNVGRVRIVAYVVSALLAALAGMLIAGRVRSVNSSFGYGFEFDVLTAVMLGGMSLFGGRGSVAGTVAGVLILAVIANGMTLSGISYELQLVVKGLLLVAAVTVDERLRQRLP